MLNRVAGLGLDDFLHEPKKGGWVDEVTLFLLAKGKKQKNRTQILKRISQKINFVLLINTFTNNIFLTCMAKSFFSLNVWITFKLVLWGRYSLNHDNMIQCLPGSPYSSFETRESWLKSLTYITLYNQRFCLISVWTDRTFVLAVWKRYRVISPNYKLTPDVEAGIIVRLWDWF